MRTAEEMLAYAEENETLTKGSSKRWRKKHFELAAEQLNPGEEALACFMGLHNFISATQHNNTYAYVVTNNRFIMAQDKLVGNNVQIVSRKHLNDVHKKTGMMYGVLTFDTIKETFNVGLDNKTIDNIHRIVTGILFNDDDETPSEPSPAITKSPVEELKEFKELLDMGIITQEEFDKKKDEVLN